MKKEQFSLRTLKRGIVTGLLPLFTVCLFSFSASAQNAKQVDPRDPLQMYLTKNKDAAHVKFYNSHPQDENAYKAIKYSMIIDNPDQYQLSKEELVQMQQSLNESKLAITQMEKEIAGGASYDHAKSVHQRTMQAKEVQNKATMGDKMNTPSDPSGSETPAIYAPK